ncbi:MAG: trigger factor [Isosphaeraceae bacterium]|nr:trigger factor [Isosphaeraceae bacterium]
MSTEDLDLATSPDESDIDSDAKRKLAYEVAIDEVGPCRKHLKVSIAREEIERQFTESLGEMTKEAHVPGFRPGHAPRRLVERKFRKEVAGQVKSVLLMAALEQIEEDHKLEAITQPELDVEAIELPESGPLTFEFEVEVRPSFASPNYRDLVVKRAVRTANEADVDRALQTLLEKYAQIVPKLEGGAALGDYVVADLRFHDGEKTLNEAKEIQFRLQAELLFQDGKIPTIGADLTGAVAGDKRSSKAEIGSSSADANLRNRSIGVEITVHDLKMLRLPVLDDAFIATLGFDSLEELRGGVRRMLDRRLEFQQRESIRNDIVRQLSERTPFDLPADLVARQERDVFRRQIYDLRDSGLSETQIRAREAEIRANAHESTLKTLKEFFILARIAKDAGLEVDDSDIENEIEAIAERTDESPRRVRARIQKENLAETMATQILERKAIDHILQFVKFEDIVLEEEKAVETLDQSVSPTVADQSPPADA